MTSVMRASGRRPRRRPPRAPPARRRPCHGREGRGAGAGGGRRGACAEKSISEGARKARRSSRPGLRIAIRALLALSALFWLMAAPPGTAAPHKGHLSPNDGTLDAGEPCGQEPDDADQVAAVRAMADEECDCDSATNHRKYLHCVAKVASEAVAEGELREECEDAVVSCASQSTCG